MSVFSFYSSPVPYIFYFVFLLAGGHASWRQWCLWKGWPTSNAIVQKKHAKTLSLLILDGAFKDRKLEFILDDNDPSASNFPVGKSILVKVHPKDSEKIYLPSNLSNFLFSLVLALSLPCLLVYQHLGTS